MTRLLAPEAPESFAVALLPSNDRPIVRLPENRRRAFRDHLRRLIGRAAAQRAAAGSSAGIASGPAHAAAENRIGDEAAASGRACATCGGRCCQPGREHAFQTTADIRRYMAAHPRAHPQQLLEAYLSRLPDRSYQDSCVYHAEIGCVLPHEMRSQTCKAFQCEEIEEFRNGLREPSFRGGIAVAICDDRPDCVPRRSGAELLRRSSPRDGETESTGRGGRRRFRRAMRASEGSWDMIRPGRSHGAR
jgi:hypothetical protein